jgi:hypothetical protein
MKPPNYKTIILKNLPVLHVLCLKYCVQLQPVWQFL